jgi:uncharacterized protein (TIRG00374 family)
MAQAVEADAHAPARAGRYGWNLFRGLMGLGAGLGAIALASHWLGVGPTEVARHLAGVPPWAVVLCAASAYGVFAAQSLRWWSVMRPLLGLRYGEAYRAQVVGAMFNIIGLRAGDLLRVQYLGRRTGKSRATILGTEIVDRWLDFWGWMPVMALLAIFGEVPRWILLTMAFFGGLLVAWAGAMVLLTRHGWAPKTGSRLGAVYASFRGGIEAFRARRTWMIALLIAPIPWLWEALAIFVTTRAFGIVVSPTQAFCVLVAFNLAMFVPSPGGVGAVEAGGTTVLVLFGADHAKALAYMFVYHFAQLVPAIATGAIILIAESQHLVGRFSLRRTKPDSTRRLRA